MLAVPIDCHRHTGGMILFFKTDGCGLRQERADSWRDPGHTVSQLLKLQGIAVRRMEVNRGH